MRFLLDTNVWIKAINPGISPVKQKIADLSPSQIILCSTVKAELYFGAYKSICKNENLQLLRHIFGQFQSMSFDDNAAKICGELRVILNNLGTPIGPYDLQIAAIAKANNLILVTHNVREFSRISDLQIEDWEVA